MKMKVDTRDQWMTFDTIYQEYIVLLLLLIELRLPWLNVSCIMCRIDQVNTEYLHLLLSTMRLFNQNYICGDILTIIVD